jgi:arylsulfatase
MTMLTGLHPESHGVLRAENRLAEGVPTLAMQLRAAGYGTAGVGCGPWLAQKYGFSRGFDKFRNNSLKLTFAGRVRARALQALAALPRGRPRFLFAHFYDAHGDWERNGNKLSYFSPPDYREDLDVPERMVCAPKGPCAILFLMAADANAQPAEFAATHFELYRRGARALDDELGRFFGELRRSGVWDDALVVLTADHGEEFGEHGAFAHTQVYRETLRVPLLVKLPRGERGGETIARPVALEDIAPTLLGRAGAEVPAGMLGFDLLSPPHSNAARPILARHGHRKERYGLRLGDFLLVRDVATGERELFDLVADPAEKHALAAEPAELARLDARLDATLRYLRAGRRTARAAAPALDAQEAAELKALGYLQ